MSSVLVFLLYGSFLWRLLFRRELGIKRWMAWCWENGGVREGMLPAPELSFCAVPSLPEGLLPGPQHRAFQTAIQDGPNAAHLAAGGPPEHQVASVTKT